MTEPTEYTSGEGTCAGCELVFRCNGRFDGAALKVVSDRPCPECGGVILRRYNGDPERWEVQS